MINIIIQRGPSDLSWQFYNWLFDDETTYSILPDDSNSIVMDNSVIIYSTQNKNPNQDFLDYLAKFDGMKYALYHLADETYGHDLSHYQKAQVVYRNFWWGGYADNVKFMPLGYEKGMRNWTQEITPASERQYVWNFAGQYKADRSYMVSSMSKYTPNFIRRTYAFVDVQNQLLKPDLIKLNSDTQFIPCPIGNINVECYRLYEALEWGCIPIVKDYPSQSYDIMFPDHPFIKVSDWDVFDPSIIDVDAKQLEVHNWYINYLNNFKANLKNELIKKIGQ